MSGPVYPFSPEVLDAMPEQLAETFRGLELRLLREISTRLVEAGGLNERSLQQIRVLQSHGISTEEIKKALQYTAGISEKQLEAVLADTVAKNRRYYGELADFVKITMPDSIMDAVTINAIMQGTKDELLNITRSMGFVVDAGRTLLPPGEAYRWALNRAAVEVQSGALSYGEAIANATRELADSGLRVVEYESGRKDQVDVAVRRAVMTGISQISDRYTEQSAAALGTQYFEVSAHAGARDTPGPEGWEAHVEWQGKVYYESVAGEPDPLGKYLDLYRSTGYGEITGLGGINCRHRRFPFFPGISERTYTDEQLAHIDKPPFEFEGRTYTTYQATQKQRQIENSIRHWKRREAAATNDEDRQAALARIRRLDDYYRDFSKAAGLQMQRERTAAYIPD